MWEYLRKLLRPSDLVTLPKLELIGSKPEQRVPNELGPFEAVIETGFPVYLLLLHLDGEGILGALTRIRNSIQEAGDPKRHIRRLLKDEGWRLHLVGAAAMLLTNDQEHLCLEELWNAFDRGSWVIPQLAVTALFSDKEFVKHARARIEARCSVAMPKGFYGIERHVATRAGGDYRTSCKALASLLAVVRHVPSQSEWIQSVSQDPEVRRMLKDDLDRADEIAERWLACALHQFAKLGVDLKPVTA